MNYEKGDFTFPRPPAALPTQWPVSAFHMEIWSLGWQQLDGRTGPGGLEGGLRLGWEGKGGSGAPVDLS